MKDLTAKSFNQLRQLATSQGFKGKNPNWPQLEAFILSKAEKRKYEIVPRDKVKERRNIVANEVKNTLEQNPAVKMADIFRHVIVRTGFFGTPTVWNDVMLALKDLQQSGRLQVNKQPGHRKTYALVSQAF